MFVDGVPDDDDEVLFCADIVMCNTVHNQSYVW